MNSAAGSISQGESGSGNTLVFLIKPEQKPAKIFELLKRLRDERGPLLEKYANLTAAICVVHASR